MTRTTMFAPLFEPLPLGGTTAPNRIMHAPMSVCYGDADGYVTRPQVEHYARRARGGSGTIITENFAVSTAGRQMPRQTMVSSDDHVPGLAELAGGVKANGALAMVQLVHAGRYAGPWDAYHEARRLAPSAVPFELTPGRIVTPHEITPEEIAAAIAEFGRAARLCERAGFDGVDVHGAQGFLISEFLSPLMNRRTDEWGGSFDNRVRFALEVVREVRRRTSPDFVVGLHLMSDELIDGGWSPKDAARLAPLLVAEGVRFLFAIPATFETLRLPANLGLYGRPRYGVGDAAVLKPAVDVPVVANGRLGDPVDAVGVLERGDADAIGLARPLFVDPDWPRKVAEGDLASVRTCPCDPPNCLRTQLSGAICDHWPPAAIARGYLGDRD
jgi:2,4-dienoyl-CoA reductase (NADPH2)